MISDLLTFASPCQPRLETIDVKDPLERTVNRKSCPDLETIETVMNLTSGLPPIEADPEQLQQVFVNLANNACQAIEAAGTLGQNSCRPGRLVISTALVHDDMQRPWIQVRFADNGTGLHPDIMPHVFEPFVTTKKPDQGTGLGLSICKRIIQEHGGRIWAENNLEGGATFVLELPVAATARHDEPLETLSPHEQRAHPSGPPPQESLRHILVVDDDLDAGHAIQQTLQQAQFQVTLVSDAEQAITLLEREPFELIISDLKMPQVDGKAFYYMVRERHQHLVNRLIFVTGDTSSRNLRSFLQSSGCTWIGKPLDVEELLGVVGSMLLSGNNAGGSAI
jgi:two-component system NtrC family sensor kinase